MGGWMMATTRDLRGFRLKNLRQTKWITEAFQRLRRTSGAEFLNGVPTSRYHQVTRECPDGESTSLRPGSAGRIISACACNHQPAVRLPFRQGYQNLALT
jgi:hypothetical protein